MNSLRNRLKYRNLSYTEGFMTKSAARMAFFKRPAISLKL